MPHAVCRLPFTYLPDFSVGFSHGSHGSCAGFAEESLPRRTRSAPRWSRVHSLELSGGRLKYCCYCDVVDLQCPAIVSDPCSVLQILSGILRTNHVIPMFGRFNDVPDHRKAEQHVLEASHAHKTEGEAKLK